MVLLAEKPLQEYLDILKSNSGISNATLITEDGLLIACDKDSNTLERMAHLGTIGAISAGILALAERAIELITDNKLDQIVLKGGKDDDISSFTIILTSVYENIILLVLFPSILNMGLILFEIQEVTKKIIQLMNEKGDELTLHAESVL